jgi:hypothetical protein
VNTDDDLQPKGLLIGFLVALAYTAAPDRWQRWFELVQAILSQERARRGCGERGVAATWLLPTHRDWRRSCAGTFGAFEADRRC